VADRRALIVGGWQGRDKPFPQRVQSLTNRWKNIFKEDRYRFRGLNFRRMPAILHNPETSKLVGHLVEVSRATSETELLFYFVGHSVSSGEDDIRLVLGLDQQNQERTCSLSWLLGTIYSQTDVRKLVMILDTCHAGRTLQQFKALRDDAFAMFGTGSAYAFDANFSDSLLRALERPIHKNDQRIDRRAGGMTYKKVFEEARGRVISASVGSDSEQEPKCFGDYGETLLLKAPVSVPDEFNEFASIRTVYGRTFRLLEIIGHKKLTFEELRRVVCHDPFSFSVVRLMRSHSISRQNG
jgi:hypothetical protein